MTLHFGQWYETCPDRVKKWFPYKKKCDKIKKSYLYIIKENYMGPMISPKYFPCRLICRTRTKAWRELKRFQMDKNQISMLKYHHAGILGYKQIRHGAKLPYLQCFIDGDLIDLQHATNGVCQLVAIAGTTVLVPCHIVKSLLLIWRSGTRRFHLQVPDLQMSCSDLA